MAGMGAKLRHRYLLLLVLTSPVVMAAEGATADAAAPAVIEEKQLVELMEEARQAMYEHDYNRAIRVYNELSDLPDHLYRRDAMESLGLAYERSGEVDEARRIYERYVQLYPQGEDSDRVRQRLAALMTATWERPKVEEKRETPANWRTYGSFYQFLRRSGSATDSNGMTIAQHALITTLDLNSRGKDGGFDIKSRVNGGYFYDMQDEPKEHQRYLSYLFLDLSHRDTGLYGRIGRQRASGGGVLGRFDGVNMGLRFSPQYAVGVVAGLPVDRTRDIELNQTRKFRGVSIEGGPWRDYWLANGYYIEQSSEGFLDRRAAGGELRYMHPRLNLYSLVDYDLYFGSLNIFTTQANWTAEDQTTYNLLIDYRNGPPVTARSALFGQSATTLQELHSSFSDSEIARMAQDRTPHYYMAAAGVGHPIGDLYRWEADVTITKLGSTPASGGVMAMAGTGAEYYYSTRFSASDYFRKGDLNILGLYVADGDNYRMVTLSANSRVPFGEAWFINPRLQLGRRYMSSGDASDVVKGAGLRVEYLLSQAMTLELDCSSDWVETQALLGTQRSQSFYVTAGYRWLF